MKRIHILLSLILLLAVLLPCLPSALAEPEGTVSAPSVEDPRFAGKTWEDVVQELLDKWNTNSEQVTVGYYNTVTGEEHYVNPDKYMVSGSMYKVPLNMLFLERLSAGEIDWDTRFAGVRYEDLLEKTIVYSDNECAKYLWRQFDSYHRYRELIAPYMGEDAETVDDKFYENNFFTARQMIHCLRVVYENQDRFPRLIESMQRAHPNQYFKRDERRFDIAHKYGYLVEGYRLYMDDCAICFTDDPILIVMFTDGCRKAYEVMAEYCTLMCDYAQYHTALRHEEEKRREEEASREAAERAAREAEEIRNQSPDPDVDPSGQPAVTGEPGGVQTPAPVQTPLPSRSGLEELAGRFGLSRRGFLACAAAVLATLVLCLILASLGRRYRVRAGIPVAAAVLLCLAALLLIGRPALGRLGSGPDKDPRETVEKYLTAMEAQNYSEASACLEGVSALGLDREPESPSSLSIYRAVTGQFSGEVLGEAEVRGNTAYQTVRFRYFDLNSLSWEARSEAMIYISQFASTHPVSELYDENGSYKAELLQKYWDQAVEVMLLHPENYERSTELQLQLRWYDGAWHIVPDDALLALITGGVDLTGEEAQA